MFAVRLFFAVLGVLFVSPPPSLLFEVRFVFAVREVLFVAPSPSLAFAVRLVFAVRRARFVSPPPPSCGLVPLSCWRSQFFVSVHFSSLAFAVLLFVFVGVVWYFLASVILLVRHLY